MAHSASNRETGLEGAEAIAARLAGGDAVIAAAAPVMRHLLTHDDRTLFSDAIVATVGGMMHHLASELLREYTKVAEATSGHEPGGSETDALAALLITDDELLLHAHALAAEGFATERLRQTFAIDPVVPPLVQQLLERGDDIAADAMRLLAAQARFLQQQRRMELPPCELPATLLTQASDALAVHVGEDGEEASRAAHLAIAGLDGHETPPNRLALLDRAADALGESEGPTLAESGPALFLTQLAAASGQERAWVAMGLHGKQATRLALCLRAAALDDSAIAEVFARLHPTIDVPEAVLSLDTETAKAILAGDL